MRSDTDQLVFGARKKLLSCLFKTSWQSGYYIGRTVYVVEEAQEEGKH